MFADKIIAAQVLASRPSNNQQPGIVAPHRAPMASIACEECGTFNRTDTKCDCQMEPAELATVKMGRAIRSPKIAAAMAPLEPVVKNLLSGNVGDVVDRLTLFGGSVGELVILTIAFHIETRLTVRRALRALLEESLIDLEEEAGPEA